MNITADIVLQIAKLAHLQLEAEEVELFTGQLQEILQYVEKLNEVELQAEPFTFSSFLPSKTRSDEQQPSLPVEESLKNAPDSTQHFFRVPRILP